jgi:hypothetical protein
VDVATPKRLLPRQRNLLLSRRFVEALWRTRTVDPLLTIKPRKKKESPKDE